MSGFLDGVLKPGQGAEMAVKREMQQRLRDFRRTGYHYRGVGDFLLQHGTFWTGQELPDEYKQFKGDPGKCYVNALEACKADPSLRYVEGVYSIVGEHFKGHAWCLAPDGGIVEVTQPSDPETVRRAFSAATRLPFLPVERWAYFGCVFPTEYVIAHRERYEDTQGFNLFDFPAYEERDQLAMVGLGSYQRSSVGWGDQDVDDEDDDTNWDEPELPLAYRFEDHEYPTLKVPFDPNRTTLPE